jgi:cytochrome c oxidase subunit I
MSYVAIADQHAHLHDPQTFLTKYVWSQDHKVIAIQYMVTAMAIGVVAIGLSMLMRLQLGFPGTFSFINPSNYYQFVTMHGMIMVIYLLTALFLGGFGNYLIPLMCGSRDMVFPYLNMVSYWVYLLAVLVLVASFFVPGGPTGAGWTLYPPQAILAGTPGADWGITLMLVSLAIFIDGRPELRRDGAAGTLPRHDADAHAPVGLGHLHGHHPRAARLPGAAGERDHDGAGQPPRHELLHAGDHLAR